MKRSAAVGLCLMGLSGTFAGHLCAQAAARDKYIKFVPLAYPRLYEQTGASGKFALFGDARDPEYRDVSPVDGMDDRRASVLNGLAVRFAPIMVQNTVQMPMDFKKLMRIQENSTVHIDTWDLSYAFPKLVKMESLDYLALGAGEESDRTLRRLLEEFHPEHPRNESFTKAKKPGRGDHFKVVYMDWKGEGPASWKDEYEDGFTHGLKKEYQGTAKTYVHPFVAEVAAETGETSGYEFVLQYWFFYPMNDGGNNHESDWEGINVVISPRKRVGEVLTASDIESILAGAGPSGALPGDEELVIARVEYRLHHNMFVLDYASPNVYLPRAQWQAQTARMTETRRGMRWFWEMARDRAYEDRAETKVNTHPLAYIGGDDKGFDQILAMPGGANRDSHGTYPYPGTYRGVGPAGASEGIGTYVDLKEYFLTRDKPGNEFQARAFKRNGVLELGDPARVEVLPDWERIIELVRKNPEAMKEWAWLVLPLRWGYPATASPGAGVVSHAETGNLGCFGPAFNPSWNKAGPAPKYDLYEPHRFPGNTPLDIQDNFKNELGFLNALVPLLSLPPLDLVEKFLLNPFRRGSSERYPIFMEKERIPFRFSGFSFGYESQTISDNFSYLVYSPDQLAEIYARLIDLDPDYGTIETREDVFVGKPNGMSLRYSVFIGRRFVTENTLFHSRSTVGQDLYLTNGSDPFAIRADLNLWEYMGSLRFNLATGSFQPFVRVGYGYARYRMENISTDGVPLENPQVPWVDKFPRHYGAGLEFVVFKSRDPYLKGIDLGVRVDYLWIHHNLGFPFSEYNLFADIGIVNADLKASRHSVNLAFNLSF